MHLADVLCYLIVMITVSGASEDIIKEHKELLQTEKRINKREATILIDSYPLEPRLLLKKPKVIYRRISTPQRYGPPPIHKYGSSRTRKKTYKSSKLNRKPSKKYRGYKQKHISPKYLASYNSKPFHEPKPRYGPPSRSKRKPESKAKKPHYNHVGIENMGFGEPPTNYANKYQPSKQTYGEPPVDSYGVPPVDSYGVPLKLNNNKPVISEGFEESNHYSESENNQKQEYPYWEYNQDTSVAYSKKQPVFVKKEQDEGLATLTSLEYNDDFEEIRPSKTKNKKIIHKRKPLYPFSKNKIVNRPWNHIKSDREVDDVVVGGQYAEPPARYVAKFQPSAPMFKEDEDTFLPLYDVIDREIGSSAKTSPYVNYKNSNLAFSPQNLNDAFSIVDK